MNDVERRVAAKRFVTTWKDRGNEKQDTQSFWTSLLRDVYGIVHPEEFIQFEHPVKLDGHTFFIDVRIPKTSVLIEQKGMEINLNKLAPQSDGAILTPFQQARRYGNALARDEHPRWIIACNFQTFEIHDMNHPNDDPEVVALADLEKEYNRLQFLVDTGDQNIKKETEVSLKAGELVGELYDALLQQYADPSNPESLKSLNALCVRLVFCLYAEDAGIFGRRNQFHSYLQNHRSEGRNALINLFHVLDQKPKARDKYLDEDLAAFPYVNGGLFADEDIEIPRLNDKIFDLILRQASEDFDWSVISPTIFGAAFESTLNPETRRKGGMHYTSIETIHKVIDPLFLDALKEELAEIKAVAIDKTRNAKLRTFQSKLAKLTFLDPACGSGNFLTETYISLRRIENEVISLLQNDQAIMGEASFNPIQVSIGQFYGIEINDFAVTVAKTALWIAESQMMKETEDLVHMALDFLPLKSYANIVEGNALRMEWGDVVSKYKLHYIIGNPPFVGSSIKSTAERQKADKQLVFGKTNSAGKLDYVACWYKKAFDYIDNTSIEVAFVSTNSITQGEQVRPLWEGLLSNGLHINFAYRTFQWDSETNDKAHVHCIIICVSKRERPDKFIVSDGVRRTALHINGYLVDAPDFYITSRGSEPKGFPKLTQGNKPWDGGGLIVSVEEREELIKKYPQLNDHIKLFLGSWEFINNQKRYCLWFEGVSPHIYRNIPEIKERFNTVAKIRAASPTVAVQKQAQTPMLFSQIRQPKSDYILVPETSSSARKYIPMGFMSKDVIVSNSTLTASGANLYIFGVMESNVHMAWVKTLCGRMKSDYRYSPALYNNFPWPTPTEAQKARIEQTAQAILDARSLYPDCSLADLYDKYIPEELLNAHRANDRAVMQAYGFDIKTTTEDSCVAELMKMHQQMTEQS